MAFEELKQRQSVVWGSGPFERVAEQIADVHDKLVAELAPRAGERWLDVGTGTGGVAVRAARAIVTEPSSSGCRSTSSTWRRIADSDKLPPQMYSARFMAMAGMLLSVSFAVVIVATAIPLWMLSPCD